MSCKVAIIVPDNDIVGHLVKKNGFYFSKENLKEVSKFIFELSKNKTDLERKKNISQELSEKYSWKNIVNNLNRIYDE